MTLSQGVILQFGGWVPLNFTAYSKQQAFPVTSSSQTSPFCQLPGQDLTHKIGFKAQNAKSKPRVEATSDSAARLYIYNNREDFISTGIINKHHDFPAEVHWPNQTNQFCAKDHLWYPALSSLQDDRALHGPFFRRLGHWGHGDDQSTWNVSKSFNVQYG